MKKLFARLAYRIGLNSARRSLAALLCALLSIGGLLTLPNTDAAVAALGAQTGTLYVLSDCERCTNQIYGYAVNETTGALTPLPDFPISTGYLGDGVDFSERMTIDRANQRLYAINQVSNTVSAYTINATTGALTPLPFNPINLNRGGWLTVSVHPSGSPLVVGDAVGRLLSFQITATTATPAEDSFPYTSTAGPFSSAFSQDGNYVYTGGLDDTTIAGFRVNTATGALTALIGSPFDTGADFPSAYATDSAGRLFIGNSDSLRVFTTVNGIPTPVTGNPFASGISDTYHGILHPNGFYLVADEIDNRVGVYRISGKGSDTTLAAVPGSPFAAGGSYTNVLALNQSGTLLFAANGDSRNLTTFSVNPATGALTALGTQPADTLGAAGVLSGMAYLPPQCPTITLSPATMPSGSVGTAYNQGVAASPAGNYTFSVSAGALPAGLSLNATTGAITGTPTTTGTASFTITATGAVGCVGSQAYTLTINNLAPSIVSLSPNIVSVGGTAFTLTVNGANFTNNSIVRWNGNNRPTTFVSATRLTAAIPASDLATTGTARVTVFNPAPNGGTSNELAVTIANAVASVSAASFLGAELAADSIVSAFGVGLATSTMIADTTPLPTTLAGTTVKVRDSTGVERLAPLFLVTPSQINYLLPAGTATGTATITVTSGNGTLSAGTVQIAPVAPGLFTANASGQGVPVAVVLRIKADGSLVVELVAQFDAATGRFVAAPIDLGPEGEQVFLILFGTGFRAASSLTNVTARIGGANAEALFAGTQGLAGLDQANLRIPRSLIGRGEVDVVLTVDGKAANTVRIGIK